MGFFEVFLLQFISTLAGVLTLAIFVRVILSWIRVQLPFGLNDFLFSITEPILGPIRRALPSMGGIDFSPFIAIILIDILSRILRLIVLSAL